MSTSSSLPRPVLCLQPKTAILREHQLKAARHVSDTLWPPDFERDNPVTTDCEGGRGVEIGKGLAGDPSGDAS